ncbi:hypothetical protein C8Q77DRAFT_189596 [Trametes polyzona]|nr:hypothetical protein C8Q77DRAFT_189596 [Trametes polyzona]
MPGGGGDRMAQNLANRHAARLKQIQEAQEAQRKEEAAAQLQAQTSAASEGSGPAPTDKRVSFAEAPAPAEQPAPAQPAGGAMQASTSVGAGVAGPSRPSPPQVTLRSSDTAPDTDVEVDEYHFPSEDDAFLASLDLDALDEGVGRPIDFEEPGVHPDTDHDLQEVPHVGGYATDSRAPGPRGHTTAHTASDNISLTRSAHEEQRAPPPRFGQANAGQGNRARTPSMGGGFSFPSADTGVPQAAQAPPAQPRARTSRLLNPVARALRAVTSNNTTREHRRRRPQA